MSGRVGQAPRGAHRGARGKPAEAALGRHRGLAAVFQEFIREGCLHTLTRKGLQQRMFFLVGGQHSPGAASESGGSHLRVTGRSPGPGWCASVD